MFRAAFVTGSYRPIAVILGKKKSVPFDLTSDKISRIRALVEIATVRTFDTIAGETPGPLED